MTNHAISFFDQIVSADKAATVYLNRDMGTAADSIFWILSSKFLWIPVALLFLYMLARKKDYNWTMKIAVVFGLIITITLCDQITSSLFKPLVARFRPSHDIEICTMLHYVHGYRGGNYGFMSSHAANAFGAAVFGTKIIRNKYFTALLFTTAILVTYSRIYLGVHFLGDVVCGAATGIMVSLAVCHILGWLHSRLKRRAQRHTSTDVPPDSGITA